MSKKAAPVDFVGGGAPPRQAVMLLLEQAVQHLARARDARIEAVQHRVERARPARGGVVAQRRVRRVEACVVRRPRARRVEALGERVQIASVRRAQDVRIRADLHGQRAARACDREPPVRGVRAQRDVARGERLAVGAAEAGQQHLALQRGVARVPVDVEMPREAAARAPFEHVVPPAVGRAAHAHVVRHDVDDRAHAPPPQRIDQPHERRLAAELGVDRRIIDHIVAVARTRLRGRDRRQIQMAHAEPREIADVRGRVVEREARMQLQAQRRARLHRARFLARRTAAMRVRAGASNSASTERGMRRRQFGCPHGGPGTFG